MYSIFHTDTQFLRQAWNVLLKNAKLDFIDNDYIIDKLLNSYFMRQLISCERTGFIYNLSGSYIKSSSLFANKGMFTTILDIYRPVVMVTHRKYGINDESSHLEFLSVCQSQMQNCSRKTSKSFILNQSKFLSRLIYW